MLSFEMKVKVFEKIAQMKNRAAEVGILMPDIEVRFDLGSVRTMGLAKVETKYGMRKMIMRLHPASLEFNKEKYIETTVVHEYAHFMMVAHFGHFGQAHGNQWKQMCRILGMKNPARCTALPLPENVNVGGVKRRSTPRKTITYVCRCMEHKLTSVRHNKVVAGKTNYSCVHCKTRLVRKEG
jgi:SprT protein